MRFTDLTVQTPLAGKLDFSSPNPKSSNAERGGEAAKLPPLPHTLRRWFAEREEPAYRLRQVLAWVYAARATSFAVMTNLPRELRRELEQCFTLAWPRPAEVWRSSDGTRKLLFVLSDGAAIESVLIPDPPRLTLCVSSQVGCGMGCQFCATARLGLRRNLSAAEILAQVLAAQELLAPGQRITNVVFMGMGEPLANYQNLVQALEVLLSDWGLGFSGRRVTVSTVGLLPQMRRLVSETPVQLAVSLTGTTEEQRSALMPVNRRYPLEALVEACRALPLPQRRRITFEYVLLAGVNDRPEDADRLAALLRGVRAKVNLIPFNPFPGAPFDRPRDVVVEQFRERLLARRLFASVRRSRGLDVQAACGQLAVARAGQEGSAAAL